VAWVENFMDTLEESKKKVFKVLFVFVIILSVYYAVAIFSEIKKASILGERSAPATISFSGHGEVIAVPDIANIYFTISKDAATVKEAQANVATIEKKAIDLLKEKGVAEKDIKTTDASSYYCPGGKQILTGYTASESITVKIRNTDDAGAIMQGLGTTGVSNLSGPNFAIDKEDELKAEARKKAIDDARAKAEELAEDLGVSLGGVVNFSESGRDYPMMYGMDSMKSATPASAPAELLKGESTVSSDVTITYEIY
jgi:uncharacterized protein YggE